MPVIRNTAGFLEGVDAVEVNISCPNVEHGGACPAQDPVTDDGSEHIAEIVAMALLKDLTSRSEHEISALS